jgi:hypothetical protein
MENENKYLDPKEAARLMLDGETLQWQYDSTVLDAWFDGTFKIGRKEGYSTLYDFSRLRRKPQKQKRQMTKWECLKWAQSDEAKGWVIRDPGCYWALPTSFCTYENPQMLQRARFDANGVDESTITDFAIEVEND